MEPVIYKCEIEQGDDMTCFFTREFSGTNVVIIPKGRYSLSETDTTYVLTDLLNRASTKAPNQ